MGEVKIEIYKDSTFGFFLPDPRVVSSRYIRDRLTTLVNQYTDQIAGEIAYKANQDSKSPIMGLDGKPLPKAGKPN